MKFKKLYEEYTSDDLYQELVDYIYEKLLVAVDNLAMQAASDIADYDPDYCSEEPNNYSMEADNKLRQAAEYFAEFLLKEAPEIIHEDLKEDFDASETIGKLNPGDKFRNRNGVIITIIEPQKDGTIQFKNSLNDEISGGSENSIQRMLYVNNYLREDYKAYDGWNKEDIIKHKSIDWANRNYEDYEDDSEEFKSEVVAYGFGKPIKKIVTMHKFFRPNPIYPPYYKAIEKPFEGVVGPMYDGNKHGKYYIHDRYETQDVYDMLSH